MELVGPLAELLELLVLVTSRRRIVFQGVDLVLEVFGKGTPSMQPFFKSVGYQGIWTKWQQNRPRADPKCGSRPLLHVRVVERSC